MSRREANIEDSRHSFGVGSVVDQTANEEPIALGVAAATGPDMDRLRMKQTARGKSEFEKMILDFKRAFKSSLGFWTKLPYELCIPSMKDKQAAEQHLPEPPSLGQQCWNGSDTAPYKSAIVEDGLSNQMHNPEVDLKLGSSPSVLNEQLFKLQAVSNHLRMAYRGQAVNWPEEKPSTTLSQRAPPAATKANNNRRRKKQQQQHRHGDRTAADFGHYEEGVYSFQIEMNVGNFLG